MNQDDNQVETLRTVTEKVFITKSALFKSV